METTKESILRKIRALQAKTEDNGCTEAEAISAAKMVQRLLDEYSITMTEIEAKDKGNCGIHIIYTHRQKQHAIGICLSAIAKFTDTKVWISRSSDMVVYKFFGHKVDTEIAEYIYYVCLNALEYEWNNIKSMGIPAKKPDFQKGMAIRLSERLYEMKAEKEKEVLSSTTAIMVIKNQTVLHEFNELGLNLRKSAGVTLNNNNSYHLGKKAGDSINFNKAINQKQANKYIG
jgi:hypothetical protein